MLQRVDFCCGIGPFPPQAQISCTNEHIVCVKQDALNRHCMCVFLCIHLASARKEIEGRGPLKSHGVIKRKILKGGGVRLISLISLPMLPLIPLLPSF